ncbi:hypothetical protein JST97_35975 [bacterium]|nr:hypothetical protein [bacterium]
MAIQTYIKPNSLHQSHRLNQNATGPSQNQQSKKTEKHADPLQRHALPKSLPQVNTMQIHMGASSDPNKAAPLTSFQASVARRLAEHQPK